MIVPLFVGREKSINALEEVMRADKQILLAAQKNAGDDDPAPDAIYQMGTLASVLQLLKLPDGTVKVLVEGTARAKIMRYTDNARLFRGRGRAHCGDVGHQGRDRGFVALGGVAVRELRQAQQEDLARGAEHLSQIDDYSKLADTIASHLAIKIADKQDVLEIAVGLGAAGARLHADGERDLRAAGRAEDPLARQAPDGEDAARVLSE